MDILPLIKLSFIWFFKHFGNTKARIINYFNFCPKIKLSISSYYWFSGLLKNKWEALLITTDLVLEVSQAKRIHNPWGYRTRQSSFILRSCLIQSRISFLKWQTAKFLNTGLEENLFNSHLEPQLWKIHLITEE